MPLARGSLHHRNPLEEDLSGSARSVNKMRHASRRNTVLNKRLPLLPHQYEQNSIELTRKLNRNSNFKWPEDSPEIDDIAQPPVSSSHPLRFSDKTQFDTIPKTVAGFEEKTDLLMPVSYQSSLSEIYDMTPRSGYNTDVEHATQSLSTSMPTPSEESESTARTSSLESNEISDTVGYFRSLSLSEVLLHEPLKSVSPGGRFYSQDIKKVASSPSSVWDYDSLETYPPWCKYDDYTYFTPTSKEQTSSAEIVEWETQSERDVIPPIAAKAPLSTNDRKRIVQRYNLIRELIHTEEVFASDLTVLRDVYFRKLQDEKYMGYICEEDINSLESNANHVLELSKQFTSNIYREVPGYVQKKCRLVSSGSSSSDRSDADIVFDVQTNVGQCMLEFIPCMEPVFKYYCDNNRDQMETCYRIRELASPMVDNWLKECFQESKNRTTAWTLDALLIKPVQRLMKYPLLLRSLLQVTPHHHPDYTPLKEALRQIQLCADRINASGAPRKGYLPGFSVFHPAYSIDRRSSYSIDCQIHARERQDLLGLKDDCNVDTRLEKLLQEFAVRQTNLNRVTSALRSNSKSIQAQFNFNHMLVQAWSKWNNLPLREEASGPHSNHERAAEIYVKLEQSVLGPLDKVRAMYESTHSLIEDRKRFHSSYSKYLATKSASTHSDGASLGSSTGSSQGIASLDERIQCEADMFVKYHASLKDGLPDLFRLSDETVESCVRKFITLQNKSFQDASHPLQDCVNQGSPQTELSDTPNDAFGKTNQITEGRSRNDGSSPKISACLNHSQQKKMLDSLHKPRKDYKGKSGLLTMHGMQKKKSKASLFQLSPEN
uniref:ARAD1C32560p n=1 Tax=Blastobotrys adeninivorans TaxID=409370 RepID=A0A060T2I9_BLAAD